MENQLTLQRSIIHNLADSKHFEMISEKLGGEKLLRRKYPALYKILLYTREKQIKEADGVGVRKTASDDGYIYGYSDSMKIRYINYDPDEFVATKSSIQTAKEAASLLMTGSLKDVGQKKLIGNFSEYIDNSNSLKGGTQYASNLLMKASSYQFFAETTFGKICKDSFGIPYLVAQTEMSMEKKVESGQKIVKNILVDDPCPIHHPDALKTVLYYNNRYGGGCDYCYNNVCIDRDEVDVYIPFSGKVELNNYFTPLFVDKNLNFKLQIENFNNGIAKFNLAHWNEIKWSITDSTLSWIFPTCWYNRLKLNTMSVIETLNLYCKMCIVAEDRAGKQTIIPIVITSGDNNYNDPACKVINKLEILWGCFAKDTRIKMEDGSSKRIQDIRKGDYIMTDSGTEEVVELITGTEKDIIVIESTQGNLIKVTRDHPVLTKSGWKRAGLLNAGDILIMEYGNDTIAQLYVSEYYDKVFSIRTKTDSTVIAEGFLMGDFGHQNHMKEQPEDRETAKEEFQEELADLMAELRTRGEELSDGK